MAESLIARLLTPEHILLRLASATREDVIRDMAAPARPFLAREAERSAFVTAVLERERLHSTGTGDGVAFPHARTAQNSILTEPLLIFGRHPQGLQFQAVDNKPVHLLFLMSAPSMTQHLQLLAALSRLMRVARLREDLMKANSAVEVVDLIEAAAIRK